MDKKKRRTIKALVVFLCMLSAAFSISYWAMAKYDSAGDLSSIGDSSYYVKMSTLDFDGVVKPYALRPLMPLTVYSVTSAINFFGIDKFLSNIDQYENVDEKLTSVYFGLVNILCIAMTGFLFFYYCRRLGFSDWMSMAGALMYFASFFTVTYYTLPMIDSMAALFIMLAFYAVLCESDLLIFLTAFIGPFAKETTFVILPMLVLCGSKTKLRKLILCLPGITAFLIYVNNISHLTANTEGWNLFGVSFWTQKLTRFLQVFLQSFNIYFLIENIQIFMFLWVLAGYGLIYCKKHDFIRRQSWLLLLLIALPPLAGIPAVGRCAFFLFPVVFPLALYTLDSLFEYTKDDDEVQEASL